MADRLRINLRSDEIDRFAGLADILAAQNTAPRTASLDHITVILSQNRSRMLEQLTVLDQEMSAVGVSLKDILAIEPEEDAPLKVVLSILDGSRPGDKTAARAEIERLLKD